MSLDDLRQRLAAHNRALAARDGRAARLIGTGRVRTHLGLVAARGRAWTGDGEGLAFCEALALIYRERTDDAQAELTPDGAAALEMLTAEEEARRAVVREGAS